MEYYIKTEEYEICSKIQKTNRKNKNKMKRCYTREQIETLLKKKDINGLKTIIIKDMMLIL